jgi:PPOX class probable F420-dependent enzyme
MTQLTDAQAEFLANPFVGVVTTVRGDGSLHATAVWVDADGGDVVFTTLRGRAKERHLRRNPHVALMVVDPANFYRWLTVDGTAAGTEKGADERVDLLARKYLGQDEYPWRRPGEQWLAFRIRAERIEHQGID